MLYASVSVDPATLDVYPIAMAMCCTSNSKLWSSLELSTSNGCKQHNIQKMAYASSSHALIFRRHYKQCNTYPGMVQARLVELLILLWVPCKHCWWKWTVFPTCSVVYELTQLREENGNKGKKLSDQAWTPDLGSIVEFQPHEPPIPVEILHPHCLKYQSRVCQDMSLEAGTVWGVMVEFSVMTVTLHGSATLRWK